MRLRGATYGEQLRDVRWQRKRLEIMERDGWACRHCFAGKEIITLNVHHTYYSNLAEGPWDYHNDSLITLCEKCHHDGHLQAVAAKVPGPALVISQPEKDTAIRRIKNQLAEWQARNGSGTA